MGRFYTLPFFLISNKTCETKASTGNSINGPITSASAIRGSSGKAVTAIASATGEFLANVVSLDLLYLCKINA